MANRIELNGSHQFQGMVWNTLGHPEREVLFIETRDEHAKLVRFSALNLRTNSFLWREITFDEPWWISLAAVSEHILLLTIYTDTNNPDKKSLIAFDIDRQHIMWWKNDLSLTAVYRDHIAGIESKFGAKKVVLNLYNGQPTAIEPDLTVSQNFSLVRPLQYQEGSEYFEVVKSFLAVKQRVIPVITIEYLEHKSLIFVSCYIQQNDLANYLYVFDADGAVLLAERIGEQLKGIGADTFFILSGYLIFVKNKRELVSYSML